MEAQGNDQCVGPPPASSSSPPMINEKTVTSNFSCGDDCKESTVEERLESVVNVLVLEGLDVARDADHCESGKELRDTELLCSTAEILISQPEESSLTALVALPLADPASNASGVNPELHRMERCTHIDVPSSEANVILDEASAVTEEQNSRTCHPQIKQRDVAVQVSQDDLLSSTSCPVEGDIVENLDASNISTPVKSPCEMDNNCNIKGNAEEYLTALSQQLTMPDRDTTEKQQGVAMLHKPMGAESGEVPKDSQRDPLLMVQPEPMSTYLKDSEDAIPSSMQPAHKKAGNATAIAAVNDSQNIKDGHDNREYHVKGFECDFDVSSVNFKVDDDLGLDMQGAKTHAMTKESSRLQATDLHGLVGSFDKDITHIQLEEVETECSSRGQETYQDLSHKTLSENDVVSTDDVSVAASDVVSHASIATKTISCIQQVSTEETEAIYCNAVGDYMQEIDRGICLSDMKIDPQTTSFASESEPLSHNDIEKGKPDRYQEVTASNLVGSVLTSEGMDVILSQLERSFHSLDEIDQPKILQESSLKPVVCKDVYSPTRLTEVPTKHVETESILCTWKEVNDRKAFIDQLGDSSGCYLDGMNRQNYLQEKSIESTVVHSTDNSVSKLEFQIEHDKEESNPSIKLSEESNSGDSSEASLCYSWAEKSVLRYKMPVLDDQPSTPLDECRINYIPEAGGSSSPDLPLGVEYSHADCKHQSDSALVSTDVSLFPSRQTGRVDCFSGSISVIVTDGTVPVKRDANEELPSETEASSPINTQTTEKLNSNSSKITTEGAVSDNNVKNVNLSKATSSMAYLEPTSQLASNVIKPTQDAQCSDSWPQSLMRNEIIEEVINSNCEEPCCLSKGPHSEVKLDGKQKTENAQDLKTSSLRKESRDQHDEVSKAEVPSSKIVSEITSENSSSRVDQEEWNSSTHSVGKNEKKHKRKSTWLSLSCCS